jgi:hypothetical protein
MEQTEINMYKDMIRKIQAELQAEIITLEEICSKLEDEKSALLETIKKQKEQINNQAKMLSDPMFVRSNEPYWVETGMQPKKTKYFEVDHWGKSYKVVASDNTGDF